MNRLIVVLCLVAFGILNTNLSLAQSSEIRNVRKGFRTTGTVSVEVNNKYGRIEIVPWNKDSVVIAAEITVKTQKEEKLSKYFDNIDFEFNANPNFVTARTIFDKNRTQVGSGLVKVRESLMISDGTITVDYVVYLPAKGLLDITNKFGDIYLGEFSGDCRIDLSNGKLKANNLAGKLNLKLNFADANINKSVNVNLEVNYGKFYLKEANSIIYKGKSSELDIGTVKSFSANASRDKIRITGIENLTGLAYFTDFNVSNLSRGIKLTTHYGDVNVDIVFHTFSDINMISKNTDIHLNFEPETKLNYDITYMKCKTDLTHSFDLLKEQVLNEKEGRVRINGFLGKNKSDNPQVIVNAESGTLFLSAQ